MSVPVRARARAPLPLPVLLAVLALPAATASSFAVTAVVANTPPEITSAVSTAGNHVITISDPNGIEDLARVSVTYASGPERGACRATAEAELVPGGIVSGTWQVPRLCRGAPARATITATDSGGASDQAVENLLRDAAPVPQAVATRDSFVARVLSIVGLTFARLAFVP